MFTLDKLFEVEIQHDEPLAEMKEDATSTLLHFRDTESAEFAIACRGSEIIAYQRGQDIMATRTGFVCKVKTTMGLPLTIVAICQAREWHVWVGQAYDMEMMFRRCAGELV